MAPERKVLSMSKVTPILSFKGLRHEKKKLFECLQNEINNFCMCAKYFQLFAAKVLLASYKHLKFLSVNLFKELIAVFRKNPVILKFALKLGCIPENSSENHPLHENAKDEHLGFAPPVLHPLSGEHWKKLTNDRAAQKF